MHANSTKRKPANSPARSDRDSVWKELLAHCFRHFLAFFFPQAEGDIDWTRPPTFLDRELQRILAHSASGNRIADKLVKVWLRSGEETWLLIHIEVQGKPEKDFARRIYELSFLIFSRFGRDAVTLVVLTERRTPYEGSFDYARWGYERTLHFPTLTLSRYRQDLEKLAKDPNPFALVVLAHLRSQESKGPRDRMRWKIRLMELLWERGYGKRDIMLMLKFIDWLMMLPRELEERVIARMEKLSREKAMPYVTSWERIGLQKGMKRGRAEGQAQGMEEGLREAIRIDLELRFGRKGSELLPLLGKVTGVARLRAIKRAVVTAQSVDDLKDLLRRQERSR